MQMRSEGTGQHLCNANLSGKVTTHKKKNEEKCMYQTEVNSRKKKKKKDHYGECSEKTGRLLMKNHFKIRNN